MKREDLGRMLERRMGRWVRDDLTTGEDHMYSNKDVDNGFQIAAEDFWNDVIDALTVTVATDPSININQSDLMVWLEDQKFGGAEE